MTKKKRVIRTKARPAVEVITELRKRWEIGPNVLPEFLRRFSHDTVVGRHALHHYVGFLLGLEEAEKALSPNGRATHPDTLFRMVYHPEKVVSGALETPK